MSHPIIRFLDRAKETTSTTGTGTITLGGAVAGFVAIGGIGDGNSTYYTITEGNEFEVGIGTYTSSGNTLSRDQVFASSNSGNKITLAGSATIFITYPADKVVAQTSGNYVGIGIDPEYQLQVSGTGSFNTVRWADGTTQISSATGDISTVSGLTVTNASNISTNTTNIAATGATNAAAISTNVTNIATNVTNIAATGATNAAAIATNVTDIATNATNIAATGATNAAAIATNASDISTNTTNIAATGATNAAAIATNIVNIATNTTNITNNATNIAATGAINAAGIATNLTSIEQQEMNLGEVSGSLDTFSGAIEIDLAQTGALNAACCEENEALIEIISGIAVSGSGDNYRYWTAKDDGGGSSSIHSLDSLTFKGAGDTEVTLTTHPTDPYLTISGISSSSGNYQYWTATDGSTSSNIESGDVVKVTGEGLSVVSFTSGDPNLVTISGRLPTQQEWDDASLGYGYWTLASSDDSTQIDRYETVQLLGVPQNTSVDLSGTDNRIVTISGMPAGDDTAIQYNHNGIISGVDEFAWSSLNRLLGVAGTIQSYKIDNASGIYYGQLGALNGTGTLIVDVDTKTSIHPYYGQGSLSAFFIDGKESPALTLHSNITYKFDQEHSSNSGHPLRFYYDAARTTEYTTNVTTSGIPGSAGAYTQIEVVGGTGTPSQLFYQCSAHAYMGNYTVQNTTNLNSNVAISNENGLLYTLPTSDASLSGYVLTSNSDGTTKWAAASGTAGSGGGAPLDAQYVTLALDGGLSDERVLVVGTGLQLTDGGANSNVTVDASGATTSNIGVVQLQDSATDGTVDKAITPNAVYDVSGVLQTNIAATGATNAAAIATNVTNIATNSTNIAATGATNAAAIVVNTTNIAATGATNAAAIATNATDIATNTTNIAATGATNAAAIATNVTNIATNATNIAATGATNAAAIVVNTTNIAATGATNAAAIATNATDIATNTTNIAATGATNAAAIVVNTTNIAATGATNAAAIATNATDIATNATNIAATGATNAAAIATNVTNIATNATNIAATGATNAAAIATNVTNISANATNIAATGATNAADIVIVSGIAVSKDNYQYWTSTDGSNNANIETTDTVKYTGAGTVTVSLASGSPSVVTISGSPHDGSGGGGGVPGGSDTNVQFNDGGSFSGVDNFTFTKAGSGILKVGTIVTNDADAGRNGVVSIGSGAYCARDGSIAIGAGASAYRSDGTASIAIGNNASAGYSSIAVGGTALGDDSRSFAGTAGGDYATALGAANANGEKSTAIGYAANDDAKSYATCVGWASKNYGAYSVSLGADTQAWDSAVSIGYQTRALEHGIALGYRANTPISGFVVSTAYDNSILSGLFNSSAAATNGYLLTSTKFGINRTSAPDAMLDVTNFAATDVGAIIQGAASQTADLTQWQNSAGTTLASMGMTTSNDRATLMVSGTIVSNVADASRVGVVSIGSGAYTTSDEGTAVGSAARAAANSIAIGRIAVADGVGAITIGRSAVASDNYGIAVGYSSSAQGENSCVVGPFAKDEGYNYATSMGYSAVTWGISSVAIGSSSKAAEQSVSIGNNAGGRFDEFAISIGNYAKAPTSGLVVGVGVGNSILSGQFNSSTSHTDGFLNVLANKLQVSGDGSVKVNNQYTFPTGDASVSGYVLTSYADGTTVWASGGGGGGGTNAAGSDTYVQFNDGGTDFGGESNFTFSKAGSGILKVGTIVTNDADAARIGAVSIGSGAYTTADNTTAIGNDARAGGTQATALGASCKATNTSAVAIGYNCTASASKSIAMGYQAQATASQSIVIGDGSNDNGNGYSTVIGYNSNSEGSNGALLGGYTQAGESSTAVGSYAKALGDYSVVIGHDIGTAANSGLVIGMLTDNFILSGSFNTSAASTNGHLVAGTKFGINRTSAPDAMLDVTNFAATDVGAIIQGAASQTADLTQWQNSAGTTVASVGMTTANDATALLLSNGSVVSNTGDYARSLAGGMYHPGNLISIGSGSRAAADNTIAIGTDAYADGPYSVALGWGCEVKVGVTNSFVAGFDCWAQGSSSVAIGNASYASLETVAIGKSAGDYSYTSTQRAVFINSAKSLANGASSCIAIGYSARAGGPYSVSLGHAANDGNSAHDGYDVCIGNYAKSDAYAIALGYKANAPTSGLAVAAGVGNSILSGQFNSSTSHTDGFLNVLANKLQVSGDGSVKVNNQYTFPTGDASVSGYVLTSYADGTTVWASGGGGGGGGTPDTPYSGVQFNDNGSFGAESNFTFTKAGSGILKVGTIVTNDLDAARVGVVSIGSGAYTTADQATAIGNFARATTKSLALGASSTATSTKSIAIGYTCNAQASESISIGNLCGAQGERSIVMGDSAGDGGYSYSIAIGRASNSQGTQSVALGTSTVAGEYSIAVGSYAKALGDDSVIIGRSISTSVNSGLVIGQGADNCILSGSFNTSAASTNGHLVAGTKFGINRTSAPDAMLDVTNFAATDVGAIIQGAASQSADLTQWQNSAGTTLASMGMTTSNDRATLMVSGTIVSNVADASRIGVVSIGSGAYTLANYGIAIGKSANVTDQDGVAVGPSASAAQKAVSVGHYSLATALYAISIGRSSSASAQGGVSIGWDADSAYGDTVLIGPSTHAYETAAVAIGSTATAGQHSVAIGHVAQANDHRSVAIGNYANAPISGLVISASAGNSILSGQFNSSTSHTDGFLNVLDNNLQVSGDGSVKVNNQYTFPTGVTASNDYVLTAQTDGTTAWASAAGGGSPGGSDTQVQFNGGGDFEGDSALVWNSGTNVLTISGHLAATTKSFLIDHPTIPEKKLQYACLEGPENGVYVRGHTNDSIIDLPDYWTALVDEDSITVQITAKDAPQPYLYVSGVANNQVHLISDRSVSAYYTINGTRKDVAPLQVEI